MLSFSAAAITILYSCPIAGIYSNSNHSIYSSSSDIYTYKKDDILQWYCTWYAKFSTNIPTCTQTHTHIYTYVHTYIYIYTQIVTVIAHSVFGLILSSLWHIILYLYITWKIKQKDLTKYHL